MLGPVFPVHFRQPAQACHAAPARKAF